VSKGATKPRARKESGHCPFLALFAEVLRREILRSSPQRAVSRGRSAAAATIAWRGTFGACGGLSDRFNQHDPVGGGRAWGSP
jgi:hypothetical protein